MTVQGPKPKPWWWGLLSWLGEDTLHRWTNWQYWRPPMMEQVYVWRDKSTVEGLETEPIPQAWVEEDGVARLIDLGSGPITFGHPGSIHDGTLGGTPMQGTAEIGYRTLTYGNAEWGQQERTTLARPLSGWYWLTGHPTPQFDRHCILADAKRKIVEELIQFDPNAVESKPPFPNQAWGFARWAMLNDSETPTLIGGRGIGSLPVAPLSATIYDWYTSRPGKPAGEHVLYALGLTLADLVGADGTLTGGLKAGSRLVLSRESESYKAMMAKGGECARAAGCLALHGCWAVDRNGYEDSDNTKAGHKPKPPHLRARPGAQWIGSNLDEFRVELSDMRVVKGYRWGDQDKEVDRGTGT